MYSSDDEASILQNMLKSKKFHNSKELQNFIMSMQFEKMQNKPRRKVAGYVPRRETFVPVVPTYER
jgi:hypothetical protein